MIEAFHHAPDWSAKAIEFAADVARDFTVALLVAGLMDLISRERGKAPTIPVARRVF